MGGRASRAAAARRRLEAAGLLLVAGLACTGCERSELRWKGAPRDAGAAAELELAALELGSHRYARWWSLPDGAVPGPSEYYPCSDCHDEELPPNPEVRVLTEDHDKWQLRHGDGKIWCLSCHHRDDRDALTDGTGRALPKERPDRVCAPCHAAQHRDFERGVHGKRVGSHRGKRVVAPCVACHDPHAPAIAARKPAPAPRRPRRPGGAP